MESSSIWYIDIFAYLSCVLLKTFHRYCVDGILGELPGILTSLFCMTIEIISSNYLLKDATCVWSWDRANLLIWSYLYKYVVPKMILYFYIFKLIWAKWLLLPPSQTSINRFACWIDQVRLIVAMNGRIWLAHTNTSMGSPPQSSNFVNNIVQESQVQFMGSNKCRVQWIGTYLVGHTGVSIFKSLLIG